MEGAGVALGEGVDFFAFDVFAVDTGGVVVDFEEFDDSLSEF